MAIAAHGDIAMVVAPEVRPEIADHVSAFHHRVHAKTDAGVLHTQAFFGQLVLKDVAVRNASEVSTDAATRGMAAVYAGEIHESHRGNVGVADLQLKR